METTELTENVFRGLNASVAPDRLEPGELTQAKNCLIGEGGTLVTRPGVRGVLTAATGTALRPLLEYHDDATGTEYLLLLSGGTTGASLRTWVKDATTTSAVASSAVFNAEKAQAVRLGKWVFLVGGDASNAGKLWRWNPTDGFSEATGLTTPSRTMALASTNTTVFSLLTASNWFDESNDAASWTYDYTFSGSTAGNPPDPIFWDTTGSPIVSDNVDPNNTGDLYARLNLPSVSIKNASFLTSPAKSGVTNGVSAKALHYTATVLYRTNIGESDSIRVTAIAFDAAGLELARQSKYVSSSLTNKIIYRVLVFSFADSVSEASIAKVKFEASGGPETQGGTNGPWMRMLLDTHIISANVSGAGGNADRVAFSVEGISPQFGPSDTMTAFVGQKRFEYQFTPSTVDFSNISYLAVPVTIPAAIQDFNLRLALRNGSTILYTPPCIVLSDDVQGTYLLADLTAITPSDRASITHLQLQFLNDLNLSAGEITGAYRIFALGSLLDPGGLSVGRNPYQYLYRERSAAGVVSKASAAAPPLTVTRLQAKASVVFSSSPGSFPANVSATIEVYRRGGTSSTFRKVAEFSAGANATGTYWTFTSATRTLLEFTPDDVLALEGEALADHDVPPFGSTTPAVAVGVHAQRLAVVSTTGVHLSHLAEGTAADGLYWSSATDPNDPNLPLLGWYRRVTANDGASIGADPVRLAPFAGRMIVLFGGSVFSLLGSEPSNFLLRRESIREGLGIIAHNACCVFDDRLWFLTAAGLVSYDVGDVTLDRASTSLESGPIARLLNPKASFGGAALNPAGYRLSWLKSHADRLYFGVPTAASGAALGTIYVYDLRNGGAWTEWEVAGVNGAAVFSSNDDTDDLFFVTSGGQISSVGNLYGDKATPGAATAAVTMTVRGRRYTHPRHHLYATRYSVTLEAGEPSNLTLVLEADSATAGRWAQPYAVGVGETSVRLKPATRVRGRGVTAEITATTIQPLTVRRWHIDATLGKLV